MLPQLLLLTITLVHPRTAPNIFLLSFVLTKGILPSKFVSLPSIQNLANSCLGLFTEAEGTYIALYKGCNIE